MITPSRWLENHYFPFENWNLNSFHPRIICDKLFEIDQWSVYINVIYHYLPLEKFVTLFKLELPLPWKALFGWNGPSGYRKNVFKYHQCIFANSLLSSIEKSVALYLNKLESPSSDDAVCQVCWKLAQFGHLNLS